MELKLHSQHGKTFGNLEITGEDKKSFSVNRINGRLTVLSRSYNFYSDVQRADDMVVFPAEAMKNISGFEEHV